MLNPFAHLMGLKPGAKSKAKSEEEDEKAKKAKSRRAEEEEERQNADDDDADDADADDDADDADADDDSDDADADDDSDDEQPKSKKAKSKKAADDEDNADASVAKGRRMERKRISKILGCKAAGDRPDLAAYIACNTSLSSAQAIQQLNIASAGQAGGAVQGGRMSLDERMRGLPQHRVGQDAATPKGAAESAVSLYNSYKGIK